MTILSQILIWTLNTLLNILITKNNDFPNIKKWFSIIKKWFSIIKKWFSIIKKWLKMKWKYNLRLWSKEVDNVSELKGSIQNLKFFNFLTIIWMSFFDEYIKMFPANVNLWTYIVLGIGLACYCFGFIIVDIAFFKIKNVKESSDIRYKKKKLRWILIGIIACILFGAVGTPSSILGPFMSILILISLKLIFWVPQTLINNQIKKSIYDNYDALKFLDN